MVKYDPTCLNKIVLLQQRDILPVQALTFPKPCPTHVLAHSTNTLPASLKHDKNTGMLRNMRLCRRRGRGKQTIQSCPTNILPEDRICCAKKQLSSRIRRNKTVIYRRSSYATCQ